MIQVAENRRRVAVDVQKLTHGYEGTPVLSNLDLRVQAGETVVIVGGSGQGKSVLLRVIAGLEEADSGSVEIGGLSIPEYVRIPPADKPFHMAMVFQHSALLGSLTVAENVTLRLREHHTHSPVEIEAICNQVLRQVEMLHERDMLPGELSGGMQKRVAIARALAVDPELLLYDEPTAELDPILTAQFAGLIQRIQQSKGMTQILVTHELGLAFHVGDRIAVLYGGKIVDLGSPDEIRASSNKHTREFVKAAQL